MKNKKTKNKGSTKFDFSQVINDRELSQSQNQQSRLTNFTDSCEEAILRKEGKLLILASDC